MFVRINDNSFSFNGRKFQTIENVIIEKMNNVFIMLDNTDKLVDTAFNALEFKNFISDSYNGDESLSDWLVEI